MQVANRLAIVPQTFVVEIIDALSKAWDAGNPNATTVYSSVRNWRKNAVRVAKAQRLVFLSSFLKFKSLSNDLIWLDQADVVLPDDWYLNVGHFGTENPYLFQALKKRRMKIALYIHDVLPITHPELFAEGEFDRHFARVRNIDYFCDYIFVNSQYTLSELSRIIRGVNSSILRIGTHVSEKNSSIISSPHRSGFVSIGTIEPRKNYLWLARSWLDFCERNASIVNDEKLTIFGKVGWLSGHDMELLSQMTQTSRNLEIVTGATDLDISERLFSARAYISASRVEGWGMPLAESLAIGTPVLATDIAAHREATQGLAQYFDLDLEQFFGVVSACFDACEYEKMTVKTKRFQAWSWNKHFDDLQNALCGKGHSK
ncbi:Glycosyl transferase, group 1 [Agrobacterium tumefaciens]|nr:Glycosyl transferase, group 1 [Agrobacterium tumefaciens]